MEKLRWLELRLLTDMTQIRNEECETGTRPRCALHSSARYTLFSLARPTDFRMVPQAGDQVPRVEPGRDIPDSNHSAPSKMFRPQMDLGSVEARKMVEGEN